MQRKTARKKKINKKTAKVTESNKKWQWQIHPYQ